MKSLFFLLVFLIPLNLFSQFTKSSYIIPSAGISIPADNGFYKGSFNAGIAYEYTAARFTAFGFEVNYARNSSDLIKYRGPTTWMTETWLDNGRFSATGFSGYMKFQDAENITSSPTLFFKTGAGFSMLSRTGMGLRYASGNLDYRNEYSTGVLFQAGAGIHFLADKKNKIVIEAQYRVSSSQEYTLKMFLINAGFAFRL
jgi:hypothetical protein